MHHSQGADPAHADRPFLSYLQLKLRRVAKPQVRDKDMGEWLCYHPTGGAITVLCDSQTKEVNTGPRNTQSLNF